MKYFILYLAFIFLFWIPVLVSVLKEFSYKPIQFLEKPISPPLVVDKTKEGVIKYIKEYSKVYGVNQELALNIARCESQYDYKVQNSSSSAQGVFQFIDGTWEYTMEMMNRPTTTPKTEIPISVEAGIFLLSKEGDKHWDESKNCWSKIK